MVAISREEFWGGHRYVEREEKVMSGGFIYATSTNVLYEF